MRASHRCLWPLLFICMPARAEPRQHVMPLSGQSVAAAAARIAAPFGVITSTFRTVEHNRAVGGVADSYHLLGRAIDVVRKRGVSHAQIAAALRAAGLHLVESLDEGTHSHFAFGSLPLGAAYSVQPHQAAASRPLIAADQHGTLKLDLSDKLHSATRPLSASREQSTGS